MVEKVHETDRQAQSLMPDDESGYCTRNALAHAVSADQVVVEICENVGSGFFL